MHFDNRYVGLPLPILLALICLLLMVVPQEVQAFSITNSKKRLFTILDRPQQIIVKHSRLRIFNNKAERDLEEEEIILPCSSSDDDVTTLTRRSVLTKITGAAAALPMAAVTIMASTSTAAVLAANDDTTTMAITTNATDAADATTISTPLEYIPALHAYVVHFYLFGERFGAVIDTGSPFLTVPSTCNKRSYKYIWGCYHPELTQASGYSNTLEGFNNNYGTVVWRKAAFRFGTTNEQQQQQQQQQASSSSHSQNLVFGVLSPELMDGPGGVFLGLIKETDQWIRPSFLGQTGYQSFCVDLRRNGTHSPKLVLSQQSMIAATDHNYIPLVRDLNRKYKAPVNHYTARASSFVVNGLPLFLSEKQPTYVIFDTGVTGMVVSQELFDGRYLQARKNREKSLWGQVNVSFTTKAGNEVELSATNPITTPLGTMPWPRFKKGNLIVLGLAFLEDRAMTIDIEDGKLQFTE